MDVAVSDTIDAWELLYHGKVGAVSTVKWELLYRGAVSAVKYD